VAPTAEEKPRLDADVGDKTFLMPRNHALLAAASFARETLSPLTRIAWHSTSPLGEVDFVRAVQAVHRRVRSARCH
jgi:hypothetical protein